jgi:hypothetical protein
LPLSFDFRLRRERLVSGRLTRFVSRRKTLSLDVEMLDDLHRVIASARYKLKSNNLETPEANQTANVLRFPSFS